MTEEVKQKRKSPERTGPIVRREFTRLRDEVGRIRDEARKGAAEIGSRTVPQFVIDLDNLYTTIDRMDLRFKMHHDGEKKSK